MDIDKQSSTRYNWWAFLAGMIGGVVAISGIGFMTFTKISAVQKAVEKDNKTFSKELLQTDNKAGSAYVGLETAQANIRELNNRVQMLDTRVKWLGRHTAGVGPIFETKSNKITKSDGRDVTTKTTGNITTFTGVLPFSAGTTKLSQKDLSSAAPVEWEHGWKTGRVIATRYKNDVMGYSIGFTFPLNPDECDRVELITLIKQYKGFVYTGGGYPGAEMFVIFEGVTGKESANKLLKQLLPELHKLIFELVTGSFTWNDWVLSGDVTGNWAPCIGKYDAAGNRCPVMQCGGKPCVYQLKDSKNGIVVCEAGDGTKRSEEVPCPKN